VLIVGAGASALLSIAALVLPIYSYDLQETPSVLLIRSALRGEVAAGLDPDDTALGGVMTPNPDTVAPNDTALDALRRMSERGYRHLPVVDGERMVGIVSIRDLYTAVNEELAEDLQQREAFIFDTGYGTG
jgi:CBS domain-containing protein